MLSSTKTVEESGEVQLRVKLGLSRVADFVPESGSGA